MWTLRGRDHDESASGEAAGAPGRKTRTSGLAPSAGTAEPTAAPAVQRMAAAPPPADDPFALHLLQRSGDGPVAADAHAVASRGVEGGGDYPHRAAIEASFGQPVTATAAVGGAAASACGDLGAEAYTYGDRVAFGSSPDLRLAAHEAAHTVQQKRGVAVEGGMGRAGDVHEQHADAVADRVVRGESAAPLLGEAGVIVASSVVQRQEGPTGTGVAAVVQAVARGDYQGALTALEALSLASKLEALTQVDAAGNLALFFNATYRTLSPTSRAAFAAVELGRDPRAASQMIIDTATSLIGGLAPADQTTLITYVAQRAGRMGGEILAEGVQAVLSVATTMQAAQAAAPNPVGPGGWSPPGNQPIPFYIGNEAHLAIALQYVAAHAGDQVFTNSFPIQSILAQMPGANPAGAAAADLLARPDIANVTRRQLYEIKPVAAAALAATQLAAYIATFAAAGMPMAPGTAGEPGTSGVVPAPGGYYMFQCTTPGIILYQYRRGTYQPQTVPVTVPVTEPETQPVTQPATPSITEDFWGYMAAVTGLTGAALVLYVIISEGSRIIPMRNAIPIP